MSPSSPVTLISRILSLLKWHLWWSTMDTDTRTFVSACTVCAHRKASQQPTAGLLCPLPVPGWPWSHIALDFGLKVTLSFLPLLTDSLNLCILCLFLNSSQPWKLHHEYIMNDPHLISQIWRVFCQAF